MFIQTQPTPNPSSMMFMPGQTVLEVTPTPHLVGTSVSTIIVVKLTLCWPAAAVLKVL